MKKIIINYTELFCDPTEKGKEITNFYSNLIDEIIDDNKLFIENYKIDIRKIDEFLYCDIIGWVRSEQSGIKILRKTATMYVKRNFKQWLLTA